MHTSCDALSTSSVNAVDAVNAFVSAYNGNAPDVGAKTGPAIAALNTQRRPGRAQPVGAAVGRVGECAEGLGGFGPQRRAASSPASFGMDEFNTAVNQLNEVKTKALILCDAAY